MHPKMTQLNVIHEVGDSDQSSGSDDDTGPSSQGEAAGAGGEAATTDTDSPVFTRKTLG